MTYKKRHKYKKTIKRKKRGGAFLKGLMAAKGAVSSAKGLTGSSDAAGSSGLTSAMSQVEGIKNPLNPSTNAASSVTVPTNTSTPSTNVSTTSIVSAVKGKGSPSPYVIIAEFILKQKAKANINYALASKLFKSPRLRENKYKKIINELKTEHMENFKSACKLIYLYYYDEYATNFSFMFDNSQDIDNICKILYVVNQQILMYSSSKTKLLSHFNEIFENNNFSNLYKKNLLNVEKDCNIMRHKIQELFKRNDKNYSYIILDLLYDLLNESSTPFINIMNELKMNNQKKMCDISTEMNNILKNCKQKERYEADMNLLHPENKLIEQGLKQ